MSAVILVSHSCGKCPQIALQRVTEAYATGQRVDPPWRVMYVTQ